MNNFSILFELSFIKKYLTPKRKHLSSSLIALLSVSVITLVVWLIVVFLSVTEGIERSWIQKLTALNAPVRLKPTSEYFASYYYNVDSFSTASHYLSKTLGEKARALISDPYNPEIDEELPRFVSRPDRNAAGQLRDPVKGAFAALEKIKHRFEGLTYQDVELSGALLRLELLRQDSNGFEPALMTSQLTNISYLASFPSKNPGLDHLLLPPSVEDLTHLLFLANRSEQEREPLLPRLLSNTQIARLETRSDIWPMPVNLLPEKVPVAATPYLNEGEVSHLMIPVAPTKQVGATIEKRGKRLFYKAKGEPEIPLSLDTPLFTQGKLSLKVLSASENLLFSVEGNLQNKRITGNIPLNGLAITDVTFKREFETLPEQTPPWPFFHKGKGAFLPKAGEEMGILIAKNFRENGVMIGDNGYLAYTSQSLSSAQELHIPIFVAGFYDPGIMAVGNKCILVPEEITQAINHSESAFTLNRSDANNLYVWFSNLKEAPKVKEAILQELEAEGLTKYWTVETFREYEFAKDLMQQFESDKYLFTLIGGIILLVACTNIISLLVILVSDKKKEIGILRAMGAKKRSIVAIFAMCGASLGLFSSLLGLLLGMLTMHNIDSLIGLLSLLQGHEALSPQFFGTTLPKEISSRAIFFASIATPLLALLAGLFPAIKASRMNTSETLRSE
ncbi:MAG: Lipoprotein-releasing system transmembrane protein LolE [Chlamydiae bacterium]|nr:Lipoprotein-releasing system transmembrane protein LolE [Chlamydiota bacterium]